MKSYKIVGLLVCFAAILFGTATVSYAERFPRARKVACGVKSAMSRVAAVPRKFSISRSTSCSGSQAVASCAGSVASCAGSTARSTTSCAGSRTVASCSGSRSTASCAGSTTSYVEYAAPTTTYMDTPTSVETVSFADNTEMYNCASGKCTPVRNTVQAVAQSAKGSLEFATRLAREGRMYHDRSYIGYENVASGASSPADAIRMWQNSPPHRRNLPYITDIQCVNGFCVGR